MKILVTGSKGVIGRPLTALLLERGHDVIGCDLSHDEFEESWSRKGDIDAPRYIRADVSEYRQLIRVFEKFGPFDMVYHAAAEFGRWNGEDYYEQVWRTNVIGTKHIIRLQEQQDFRLVHFSSSEVYGDYHGEMIETVTDGEFIPLLNDYAMTKRVNEMQIRNSQAQYKTQTVIVRLFNVYGPGEYYSPYRSVNCRFLYCALKGIPLRVHGGHSRTSTYITDAISTLANITLYFKPGSVYNIGGVREHTIEELAETAIKMTGRTKALIQLTAGERMTTVRKQCNCKSAMADLAHKSTVGLEDGMRQTAEWMKKVYGL